jgi:hypothetical protein
MDRVGYAGENQDRRELALDAQQAVAAVAAFGSLLCSSIDFTGLFVKFSAAHLFL